MQHSTLRISELENRNLTEVNCTTLHYRGAQLSKDTICAVCPCLVPFFRSSIRVNCLQLLNNSKMCMKTTRWWEKLEGCFLRLFFCCDFFKKDIFRWRNPSVWKAIKLIRLYLVRCSWFIKIYFFRTFFGLYVEKSYIFLE